MTKALQEELTGQETWRDSSVQYRLKTGKRCMVSNCIAAKTLCIKITCVIMGAQWETHLLPPFYSKRNWNWNWNPFPSIILFSSFLQNYTTSHISVSSVIILPEKLIWNSLFNTSFYLISQILVIIPWELTPQEWMLNAFALNSLKVSGLVSTLVFFPALSKHFILKNISILIASTMTTYLYLSTYHQKPQTHRG